MVLRPGELQLTRGESVRDTALVLSRHVVAIGLRTGSEARRRIWDQAENRRHAQEALLESLVG